MKSITLKKILLTFIISLIFVLGALSQNENSDDSNKKSDWRFSIAPYALLASQSTDVGGQSIRQSFNDLANLTNAGFQILATVGYKKFDFSFDGTFAELGSDLNQGPLMADLVVNQKIFGFKGAYKVYENFELEKDNVIKGWDLKVNLGGKYWWNKIEVDYQIVIGNFVVDSGVINEDQDWWDLMIGLNPRFVISKKFVLSVDGNIGGFGIGNSSDFAYDLTYLNSFIISKLIAIHAGFRSFKYKRVDGSGDDKLETKVSVLGPMLGVSFKIK